MSKKLSLAGALDAASPAPKPTPTEQPTAKPSPRPSAPPGHVQADAPTPRPRRTSPKDAATGPRPSGPMGERPKYLTLDRKEARITSEQADELARLTRQLNKSRQGRGERITDNTLIRVALDLLLQRADQLTGTTEEELRKSVTS